MLNIDHISYLIELKTCSAGGMASEDSYPYVRYPTQTIFQIKPTLTISKPSLTIFPINSNHLITFPFDIL